jgi:hypothetical protein
VVVPSASTRSHIVRRVATPGTGMVTRTTERWVRSSWPRSSVITAVGTGKASSARARMRAGAP